MFHINRRIITKAVSYFFTACNIFPCIRKLDKLKQFVFKVTNKRKWMLTFNFIYLKQRIHLLELRLRFSELFAIVWSLRVLDNFQGNFPLLWIMTVNSLFSSNKTKDKIVFIVKRDIKIYCGCFYVYWNMTALSHTKPRRPLFGSSPNQNELQFFRFTRFCLFYTFSIFIRQKSYR